MRFQRSQEKLKKTEVAALARTSKADIDRAWGAIQHAAKPRIHTFIATSDLHMHYKLNMTKDAGCQNRNRSGQICQRLLPTMWNFQRKMRLEAIGIFCARFLRPPLKRGATTINIPDTVGYAIPMEFSDLVKYVMSHTPNINKAVVSVHCHNDLGLATANTLASLKQPVQGRPR